MVKFVHPPLEDITLAGILNALGDRVRMGIVRKLMLGHHSCSEASPCPSVPKSTLSHHFRILREAGLVRTTKSGVEHNNVIRSEEIESKFPNLLKIIMEFAEKEIENH